MSTKLFVLLLLTMLSLQCNSVQQVRTPTQYRVAWYNKADSTRSGFGEWDSDSLLIAQWVSWGNVQRPEIYHFVERKQ